MPTQTSSDGTDALAERLRRYSLLEEILADPPTPEERAARRAELKWFDAAVKPFLYRLVRYELEIPGGLSARRDYWICPRAGIKIDLRTGIVYRLADGKRVGHYFELWMLGKGYSRFNFPAAKRSLRAWIVEQQRANPEPEERSFTENVEVIAWIFFSTMFLNGPSSIYRGTTRKVWLGLRELLGPVVTRRLFDLSSHHQLLFFFRYFAAHPNPLFSVVRISGPRKKEEIWELRDRGFNRIASEFASYAEAYARAHLAHGYGSADAEPETEPETNTRGNSVSPYSSSVKNFRVRVCASARERSERSRLTEFPRPQGRGEDSGVSQGAEPPDTAGAHAPRPFLKLKSGIVIPLPPTSRS
jgi:hypothetical protein